MIRTQRQRVLVSLGLACLMGGAAVCVIAEIGLGGGFLDFYPALLYVGVASLLIAYLRQIRRTSAAVALAWMLRAANAVFLLTSVLMLFFLLPINSAPGGSTSLAILQDGALLATASLIWWAWHREISLALRDQQLCNY